MPEPVILLIYALAVARVTGLIYADSITEPARSALLGWLDDRPKTLGSFLAELIGCPWCVSIWVGAVAAPMVYFWGDHPLMIIAGFWLALSQVAGMTHNLGR